MPIYEYNCGKCGKLIEALIRSDKDIPTKCPDCGSSKITKAFSAFAVTSASASNAACETCPSAEAGSPCQSSGCASGGCPYS